MAGLAKIGDHKTPQSFVSEKAKQNEITKQIITAIYPYYPGEIKVIGAWLNQDDAIWKINWHWESLIFVIDKAIDGGGLSEKHATCARAIRAQLMTNPPNPKSGYREKNKLGDPKDKSSMATILARHRILKQSKKDWRSVMNKAGIAKSLDKETGGLSVLVVQNVLPPKKTNHRTGWALDIKGRAAKKDNPDIIRISKGLGATLTYDEAFHIHVEFEGGVKGGGTLPASVASDPVPQSEIGEAVVEESPAREAAWWDPSELLKTTGKGWSKILSDFF